MEVLASPPIGPKRRTEHEVFLQDQISGLRATTNKLTYQEPYRSFDGIRRNLMRLKGLKLGQLLLKLCEIFLDLRYPIE